MKQKTGQIQCDLLFFDTVLPNSQFKRTPNRYKTRSFVLFSFFYISIVTNDASYGYLCAQQMLQHIMPRHEKQRRMKKKRAQSRFSARNHWNLSVNRYHTFYITLCVHHSMWLRKSSCSWTVYYIVVVIFHAVVMFIFCCVLLSSIFFVRSFFFSVSVCFKILVVLSTNWHLFSVLLHVLDTYAIFRIEFCIQLIAIGNFLNYIYDWELFSANYFQWIMQFSNQLYGFFFHHFYFQLTTAAESKESAKFKWNTIEQNIILGSFFWGYVLTELPGLQ